jgi:hypothetical protein
MRAGKDGQKVRGEKWEWRNKGNLVSSLLFPLPVILSAFLSHLSLRFFFKTPETSADESALLAEVSSILQTKQPL